MKVTITMDVSPEHAEALAHRNIHTKKITRAHLQAWLSLALRMHILMTVTDYESNWKRR